jgi:hypothetical protein
MKRYFFRSAYILAFIVSFGVVVASAQDIPTISLSIPQAGQAGAPVNGAQIISQFPPALLLRERALTVISGNSSLESGSIRISRSTSGSLAPITINYSLEYFNAPNASSNSGLYNLNPRTFVSLPNISSTIRQLPIPFAVPSPFTPPIFTPPFPSPYPIAINGLQGDLAPSTILRQVQMRIDVASAIPGTFTWENGVSSQLINFQARYSDQQWYPRDPARQGLRVAILRLLSSTLSPPAYRLQTGSDSALIVLDDPEQTSPIVTNAITDIIIEKPQGRSVIQAFELETPRFRADNLPQAVFYDDNYDIVTFTPSSSAKSFVDVRMIASSDPLNPAQSRLVCTVAPDAPADTSIRITVQASDGTIRDGGQRRLATTDFFVRIVSRIPTAVAETRTTDALPSITTSPNPVTEKCLVSTTIPDAGFFTLRVTDVLGTVVYNASVQGARGSEQQHTIDMAGFAAGTYFVEVNDGARTSSRKIVKM